LLLAFLIGSGRNAVGFAFAVGVFGLALLAAGFGAKKSAEQLATAQTSWDKRWICERCGYQWEET